MSEDKKFQFGDAKFIGPSVQISRPGDPPADGPLPGGNPWFEVPEGIKKIAQIFCGCGDSVCVWQTIFNYLEAVRNYHEKPAPPDAPANWPDPFKDTPKNHKFEVFDTKFIEQMLNPPAKRPDQVMPKMDGGHAYLLAYLLDHFGLTEHGSLIDCCWLTAEGEKTLAFLKDRGVTWQSATDVCFFYFNEVTDTEVTKEQVIIGGRAGDGGVHCVHLSRAQL